MNMSARTATRRKVRHRQGEQTTREEVERLRVDANGRPTEEEALDDGRRDDHAKDGQQADEHEQEQLAIAVRNGIVDDLLREDRDSQLKAGRDQREQRRLGQRPPVGQKEGLEPPIARPTLRHALECGGAVEERGIARPFLVELLPGDLADASGRVSDPDVASVDVVEDDPVVSVPVDDRGQRQAIELALRGANGPHGEPELLGPARDPEQARAVGRRVHELANPGQGDVLAEVPRHHRQAGRAAIHLVELVHVREAAPAALAGRRLRRLDEGFGRFLRQSRPHLDLVQADLLHGLDLRREELLGEVQRYACHLPELPLRGPLLDPLPELRIRAEQLLEQLRRQGKQSTRCHGLDARRPRLSVQDRQLREEVALA